MFSIPRDLWVDIPGRGPERINVVDCYGERVYGRGGGPRLVSATLDRNFGITTDAYVRVDFGRLERVIDALGGITITSDRALDDWLDDGSPALLHFQLAAGTHHLDGHTAMLYARTRRQTGDLDRCRRQQQIILAMREAALSPGILPRLPELLSALWGTVETDLPLTRVLSLMRLAGRIDRGSIRTRVFNSNMVRDWVTPAGAMVLLPNRALIVQAWDEVTAP